MTDNLPQLLANCALHQVSKLLKLWSLFTMWYCSWFLTSQHVWRHLISNLFYWAIYTIDSIPSIASITVSYASGLPFMTSCSHIPFLTSLSHTSYKISSGCLQYSPGQDTDVSLVMTWQWFCSSGQKSIDQTTAKRLLSGAQHCLTFHSSSLPDL